MEDMVIMKATKTSMNLMATRAPYDGDALDSVCDAPTLSHRREDAIVDLAPLSTSRSSGTLKFFYKGH